MFRFAGCFHYYNLEPSGYRAGAESNGSAAPLFLKEEVDGYCVIMRGTLPVFHTCRARLSAPTLLRDSSFYLALSDAVFSPGLDRGFTHGSFTNRLQL